MASTSSSWAPPPREALTYYAELYDEKELAEATPEEKKKEMDRENNLFIAAVFVLSKFRFLDPSDAQVTTDAPGATGLFRKTISISGKFIDRLNKISTNTETNGGVITETDAVALRILWKEGLSTEPDLIAQAKLTLYLRANIIVRDDYNVKEEGDDEEDEVDEGDEKNDNPVKLSDEENKKNREITSPSDSPPPMPTTTCTAPPPSAHAFILPKDLTVIDEEDVGIIP